MPIICIVYIFCIENIYNIIIYICTSIFYFVALISLDLGQWQRKYSTNIAEIVCIEWS